jgi:hypothetical protein
VTYLLRPTLDVPGRYLGFYFPRVAFFGLLCGDALLSLVNLRDQFLPLASIETRTFLRKERDRGPIGKMPSDEVANRCGSATPATVIY